MLILQEVERIRRAGLGRIPFIYCMKMKDRGQVLSRNSMGLVEAVMHLSLIHILTGAFALGGKKKSSIL